MSPASSAGRMRRKQSVSPGKMSSKMGLGDESAKSMKKMKSQVPTSKKSSSPTKDSIVDVGGCSDRDGGGAILSSVKMKSSFQDERRRRLRPDTSIEYNMVVDADGKMRKVEHTKPTIKPKLYEEVVDPVTHEVQKVSISRDSDMLKLSILDSQDSNEVSLHYKEPKINHIAFEGSFSEAGDSPGQMKFGKSLKKSEFKLEKVPLQMRQVQEEPSSKDQSSTVTMNFNPKSKETSGLERSDMTEKARITGLGHSRNNEAVRASSIDFNLSGVGPRKVNDVSLGMENRDLVFGNDSEQFDHHEGEDEERQTMTQMPPLPPPKKNARNKNPFRKLAF